MRLKYCLVTFVLILAFAVAGCGTFATSTPDASSARTTTTPISSPTITSSVTSVTTSTTLAPPSAKLEVYFLDVGQGDSEILRYGNNTMLIDAGTNASTSTLINDIKGLGINKFDVVVATHPHEDHIGGLDAVINQFGIGTIYMPKVTTTTKTFSDVIQAIKNKGLTITTPTPGSTFNLGPDICTILAPNSQTYSDLNSYSIVIRVVNGNNSFLFTGDAQVDSEKEMLAKGFNLKSDVLKVGHHGSNTSTSPDFLKVVSPKYAVIEVGAGNDYGHPHQITLDKLNSAGAKIYRTDLNGTIEITSDGTNLNIVPAVAASLLTSSVSPTTVPSPPAILLPPLPASTSLATNIPINNLALDILSVISPVKAGSKATLAPRAAAGAQCVIKVYYKSGLSSASGLSSKIADSGGNVSWTWTVGNSTTPGTWKIVVEASLNGQTASQTTNFTVQ